MRISIPACRPVSAPLTVTLLRCHWRGAYLPSLVRIVRPGADDRKRQGDRNEGDQRGGPSVASAAARGEHDSGDDERSHYSDLSHRLNKVARVVAANTEAGRQAARLI